MTSFTDLVRRLGQGTDPNPPEPDVSGILRYDIDQSAGITPQQKAYGRNNIGASALGHTHPLDEVAGLVTALGNLQAAIAAAKAVADAAQPADADLAAIAALATTPFGRGLLTMADDDAVRAVIEAAAAVHTHPVADLSDASANGRSLISAADYATMRTLLGVAVPQVPPVRQTVLSGPAAAGAPSFWPATASGLTLTTQNLAAGSPLILACAKGFDADGQVDAVTSFTANFGVAVANGTSFVYRDFDTSAWAYSTLVPKSQYGGTIDVTNGQYTFDRQSLLGWVGNGAVAVRANRVYIGEVVASGGDITSAVPYAYRGQYEGPWVNGIPGPGVTNNASHNIGVQPQIKRVTVENVIAEFGYVVGEQVSSDSGLTTSTNSYVLPPMVAATRTSVSWATHSSGVYVLSKLAASQLVAIGSSWRWRLEAQRGW